MVAWNLLYKHRIPTGFSRQTPEGGGFNVGFVFPGVKARARLSLASQKARSLALNIIDGDVYLSSFDRRLDNQIFQLALNHQAAS